MTESTTDFAEWIGRKEATDDDLSVSPTLAAAATLDDRLTRFENGSALPPLWHWFYFLPRAPQSQLDIDGHPKRGGFMPPIPYPRRMFAGSRMQFHRPLIIGQPARREAVIRDIKQKSGRSGSLAFVSVVWSPAAENAWTKIVTPDPRLLFRFSALTFNAHRIHYDRPYATSEEGYPGLVVHGPLTAVLLMELVRHHAARPVSKFSFRGLAPLFDLAPFRLVGIPDDDRVSLEAHGPDGSVAMSASAEFA